MQAHLIRTVVLPFLIWFVGLALATLLSDWLLHRLDLVWVGRYLGIPGTLLIIGSFAYSLAKRRKISTRSLPRLLSYHEVLAWLGSLMVLVHAGVHFNAILGWLAVAAMLVNVASGLTGKFLIKRARERLRQADESPSGADDQPGSGHFWDSLTVDAVTQWRKVHFPIAFAFGFLALAHIISIFLFWGWR
ncbi:hypothetical protein [Chromobacterium sp.]|uniref:hypothetical protein n=1 Tax=Chromobacterium sp. TaxID=306190 RepID=UPI0035AFB1FD